LRVGVSESESLISQALLEPDGLASPQETALGLPVTLSVMRSRVT
jgi:hypothetical protein